MSLDAMPAAGEISGDGKRLAWLTGPVQIGMIVLLCNLDYKAFVIQKGRVSETVTPHA